MQEHHHFNHLWLKRIIHVGTVFALTKADFPLCFSLRWSQKRSSSSSALVQSIFKIEDMQHMHKKGKMLVKNIFNTQTQNLKIRPLFCTMGIAPSHFEERQQREEVEQSAKALTIMNAHHARSISFGEEIPSDLECTICAEVRVYSFVSETTYWGWRVFRARARCFESAEGKRKREWERVSAERLLVAIPVTMWDRWDDASNESTSLSLFCLFSLSFLSRRKWETFSRFEYLLLLFFSFLSLSLHLSLIYV